MNLIALVNNNDEIVGYEDKLKVHQDGLLHRAFSIIVFNINNEILLQKRASTKYHSPGLWTNTCCSHLPKNQRFYVYMRNRLKDEMGLDCELEFKFKFTYKAEFPNGLIEHETDHVYFGYWNGTPEINPEEADDYKWISIKDLKKDMNINPENYTYWFKEILKENDYFAF